MHHNIKHNALRSDPPVDLAAANIHMVGSWGSPLQQHTGYPNSSRSPLAAANWTPYNTPVEATQHSLKLETLTSQPRNMNHFSSSNQTATPQIHTNNTQIHLNTQAHFWEKRKTQNSSNTQDYQITCTHNNDNTNLEKISHNKLEPSHTLPSRGSTGQPRSLQTCGDQKRPPLPPKN